MTTGRKRELNGIPVCSGNRGGRGAARHKSWRRRRRRRSESQDISAAVRPPSGFHTSRPQTAQLSRTARHYAHAKAYPRRRPALRARTKEGWSTSDLRGEDSGGVLPEGRRAGAGVGSDWSGGVFFFFRNVARVSDLQGKGGNVKKKKKTALKPRRRERKVRRFAKRASRSSEHGVSLRSHCTCWSCLEVIEVDCTTTESESCL